VNLLKLIEFVPLPFLIGIGFLVLFLATLWRKGRRMAYLFCVSVFWLYLMLVVAVTLFPIPLPDGLEARQSAAHILSRVNWTPLYFGGLFSLHPNVILRELAGNIVLTIPLGFGVNFLARCRARHMPFLAAGVGLVIETAQLLVSLGIGGRYRGVDINDVLLNAAGVLIGYGLFRLFAWMYRALTVRLGILNRGLQAYIYAVAHNEGW